MNKIFNCKDACDSCKNCLNNPKNAKPEYPDCELNCLDCVSNDTCNRAPLCECEDAGCRCNDSGEESEWVWNPHDGYYQCEGCGETQ